MSFASVTVTETSSDSNTNDHHISMPPVVNAGDILIILFGQHATQDVTVPGGLTNISDQDTVNGWRADWKFADGTEGGTTVNYTTAFGVRFAAQVLRITGHGGAPAWVETTRTYPTQTLDPSSLTPTWGAADTLWIVTAQARDDSYTLNAPPSGFSGGTMTKTNVAGTNAMVASAYRQENTATQDPGAWDFTTSLTRTWYLLTIGIRPASLMAGNQPAPSGALTALGTVKHLSGNQPAPAGSIGIKATTATVAGNQAAATGTIVSLKTRYITLAGNQAAATGTIVSLKTRYITLAGNQAAPSGALALVLFTFKVFPIPAGTARATSPRPASGSIRTRRDGVL